MVETAGPLTPATLAAPGQLYTSSALLFLRNRGHIEALSTLVRGDYKGHLHL